MSAHILAAISHLPQLRGSLRHTAQRLAYFADGTAKARKSFSFLAKDMHVSERTVKRHVARLQAMGVIIKDTVRLTVMRYATNVYTFIMGVDHLHKRTGDRVLPEGAKREKSSRARDEKTPDQRLAWLRTVGLNPDGVFLQGCIGP
jgi:DNA-binding transcriptional ArsR family regulator